MVYINNNNINNNNIYALNVLHILHTTMVSVYTHRDCIQHAHLHETIIIHTKWFTCASTEQTHSYKYNNIRQDT